MIFRCVTENAPLGATFPSAWEVRVPCERKKAGLGSADWVIYRIAGIDFGHEGRAEVEVAYLPETCHGIAAQHQRHVAP